MAITFDNSGKPTYMFQAGATSTDGVWYAVGAKIDTAAGYEWAGAQTFLNTVTTDATVILRDGFNNFLNPAARDAALTAPVAGTLVFVRQDSGGSPLNQIQFYSGAAWVANDGDISGVTAGAGLTGGGTAGTISLAVDTTVVATTSNTLTMTNKTISGASNTITNVSLTAGVTGTLPVANGGTGITSLGTGIATFLGTPSSANLLAAVTDETGTGSLVFATSPTLVTPNIGVASGTSLTLTGDLILNGTNFAGSVQDELTLILMGAL